MIAEVAIKASVFKWNAASVIPLIAPPVPINPAINPENTPPNIEFVKVGCNEKFLNINSNKLTATKKNASKASKSLVFKNLLK